MAAGENSTADPLPAIQAVEFFTNKVVILLASAPSTPITGALFKGNPVGTGWIAQASNVSIFVTIVVDASSLDPNFQYTVALSASSTQPVWGPPVEVVFQVPTVTSVQSSTTEIDLAWTVPATTNIASVFANLVDPATNNTVASGTSTQAGIRLVPSVPLISSTTYNLTVFGQKGIATGPWVTPPNPILISPTVASEIYSATGTGTNCTIVVTPTTVGSPPGTVNGQLWQDSSSVASVPAAGGTVTFPVTKPLDPRFSWRTSLYYTSGIVTGPSGPSFPITIPSLPNIAQLYCGAASILVALDGPALPIATVALFKGAPSGVGWVSQTTTSSASASLTNPGSLDPGSTYYIALTLDTTATPVNWVSSTALVFQTPTIASVSLSANAVDVSWTLPGTTNISQVDVTLYDQTASVAVASGSFAGTTGHLNLPVPLNPAHTYFVNMAGAARNATGPLVTSSNLILTSPSISAVTYSPGQAAQTWSIAVTASSPSGAIVGRLFANGNLVTEVPGNAATVTFPLTAMLDPTAKWQVGLFYKTGLISGPISPLADIPVAPPVLTQAAYDGTQFTVSWNSSLDSTGAYVSIMRTDTSKEIGSATVPVGSTATFAPTTAVDPTKPYKVFLYPLLGLSKGLSDTGTSLIVAAPSITAVSTDGQDISVTCASVGSGQTAIALQSGGTTISSNIGGVTGGYIRVPSVGLTSPTVSVQAVNGVVSGPASTGQSVVLAVPTISALVLGTNNVTGTVTAPSGGTLTSPILTVSLYADGTQVGPSVAATAGAFTLPFTPPIGAALTVRANYSGQSGSVAVAAPLCLDAPVLTMPPNMVSASLVQTGASAWQINAEWASTDTSQVSYYTVALIQTGATLKTWTVSGVTLSETAPAFDATKVLTLTVTPQGNFGTAPVSQTLTFIPKVPTTSSALSDGNSVAVQWATASGATGYRVRLVQSDGTNWHTVSQSETVTGTTASFSVPSAGLDLSNAYGVVVDVQVGVAWTSTSVPTPLPMQPPAITSVTATASNKVNIVWTAPAIPASGITNYQPVVTWNGSQTLLTKVPATPLNASITLPAGVPNDAAISLLALIGTSSGPAALPSPIVVEQSSGIAVAYDGANLTATWNASSDPRVNAYSVTLVQNGGAPVTTTVSTNLFQKAIPSPGASDTATIAVAPSSGASTGLSSTAISAVLHAPTVQTSVYDGENLALTWSSVTGATGYQVSILSGGATTQSVSVGGTSAVLPLPTGAFTVKVQALGIQATGPTSAAFTPLFAAATINSTTFDTAASDAEIKWTDISATAYNVQFMSGGKVALAKKVSAASLTLATADLPPSGTYTVQVQAADSATDNNNLGPWSTAANFVVIPPTNVNVDYDGRNAKVKWDAVPSDSAAGYLVSILGAASAVSVWSPGTSATIPLAYDSTKTFTVVVQAATAFGTGQPSTAVAVFQPGWYASTDTTKAPYLAPATTQSMAPSDIVVYLPNIFATTVTNGLPATQPFVFANTTAPFAYTLTMAHDSAVWTFTASPIRTAISAAYTTLLQALTTLGITPGGWRLVQDAIARAMPQTFAESLFYGFGLVPNSGYIDLKPGMVLRAEYQSYQYLGPGGTNTDLLNGYVTSAVSEYEIGSYIDPLGTSWLTGLDSFLSSITAQGSLVPAPHTTAAGSTGGGGSVDTYYSLFRQPFLRLVYPPNFLASVSSDPKTSNNVALIAAADYQTLNNATGFLRNAQPLPSGVSALYFRGRTVLSAGIRVWVDDVPVTVPVGSTVASLLQNMGKRPPVMASLPVSGLRITRSTGSAIQSSSVTSTGYPVSNGVPVFLDWASGTMYDSLTDWLALPLQPGDRIETRGSE